MALYWVSSRKHQGGYLIRVKLDGLAVVVYDILVSEIAQFLTSGREVKLLFLFAFVFCHGWIIGDRG